MSETNRAPQTPSGGRADLSPADRRRILANLRDETDGAAIYDALARSEKDEKVAAVYDRLATVERRHAGFWRERLLAAGYTREVRPSGRARLLAFIGKRFGPSMVLPTLARGEVTGGAGRLALGRRRLVLRALRGRRDLRPVAPFLFSDGWTAIGLSIAFSGVALAAIGGATSMFTGRGLVFSATRQIAIGYAAAIFTVAVGRMIGARVS